MQGNTQDYAIRPLEDVLSEIDAYAEKKYHGYPVFLAGGNPTSAPTDYLTTIIKYVRVKLKEVPRVSSYCKALDVLRKSDDELKQLANAGLDIVYMGLESGSSKILRIMKKGTLIGIILICAFLVLGQSECGSSNQEFAASSEAVSNIQAVDQQQTAENQSENV